MRVLACYTKDGFHPEAEKALRAYAPMAELVDVTGDDFAYWREIRARWAGEEDLILVEQDVEIVPGGVGEMAACEHDWCCYAYTIYRTRQRLRYGLGFTKFSARAQQLVNARRIAERFTLCKNCKGQGCWYHLDGRISELMRAEGLKPHVHGDVTHHHDYGTGPVAVEVPGRPAEWFDEDFDYTPAVVVADHWPRMELYAVSGRQAAAIAEDLLRLQGATGNEPAGFVMPEAGFATDKVSQGYLPVYSRLARHLGPAARICEVGVAGGGSLDMWRVLFPQAAIAGIDRNPNALWPEGTIRIVAGQDDPRLPRILDSYEESWDLIVDDASHDGQLTEATLNLLWPLVSPGGFYIIEDWFTGYTAWRDYDDSMLRMAKSLLDRLDPGWAPTGIGSDVESIEYRHGLAILRKAV
jgi:hypothetical protein